MVPPTEPPEVVTAPAPEPPPEQAIRVEKPVVEEPVVEEPVVEEPVVEEPVVEEPVVREPPPPVEPTRPIVAAPPRPDPVPQTGPPPERAEPAARTPEPEPAARTPEPAVIPGPGSPEAAHHDPVRGEPVAQEFFQSGTAGHEGPDPRPGEQQPAEHESVKRARPTLTVPVVDPRIAAALTGAVVGLIGLVLATGAGRGCEAVRGVGSCGGIGLLVLLVVLGVQVVIGGILLRACRVTDPASTAFLGVGMMAVIVLLFLLGSLESRSMIVVLPIVTGLTFLLSWWVTETFVEGGGD
jgi:hypothetical protein